MCRRRAGRGPPHTADDHVTADPGLLRRGDQLHCTAVVHRLFPRRPTSGTGARGEYDGIGAGYRLGDVVLARVLEVNHCWLGASASDVVGVVGVADQGDDFIAALGQDLGEAQSDLAVSSGDGYSHGPNLTSFVPTAGTQRGGALGL
jgi:hypothetical protein